MSFAASYFASFKQPGAAIVTELHLIKSPLTTGPLSTINNTGVNALLSLSLIYLSIKKNRPLVETWTVRYVTLATILLDIHLVQETP